VCAKVTQCLLKTKPGICRARMIIYNQNS
jgi:hypothetical protein